MIDLGVRRIMYYPDENDINAVLSNKYDATLKELFSP